MKVVRRQGPSGQNKSNSHDINNSDSYLNIEICGAGLMNGNERNVYRGFEYVVHLINHCIFVAKWLLFSCACYVIRALSSVFSGRDPKAFHCWKMSDRISLVRFNNRDAVCSLSGTMSCDKGSVVHIFGEAPPAV